MTTTEQPVDVVTLTRPEGITDGRWAALQAQAHLIITGHAPWCQEHRQVGDADWCLFTMRSFAGDAELHNSGADGRATISFYTADGINTDDLTIAQAAALGAVLEGIAHVAKSGNLMVGVE